MIEQPEQPGAEPPSQSIAKPAPSSKKPLLIGLVVAILIAAAGGLYWKLSWNPKQSAQQTARTAATPSPTPLDKAALLLQRFTRPTTGETWLATPEKLPAQGFLRNDEEYATYYRVGQHGPATILMSDVATAGELVTLYEKTPDGKISAIIHPDGDAAYDASLYASNNNTFTANVSINTTTHYDSLTLPSEFSIGQGYTAQKPAIPDLGRLIAPGSTAADTTISTIGPSKLVRSETVYADTKLTSITYAIVTPINTKIALTFQPLEADLKGFQWTSGATPADTISSITRGCGAAMASVTRSDTITPADVQTVGKSPSGLPVYELKSIDHPLITKAYQEFKDFYQGTATDYANITKAEFASQHGVIIIKDKFNRWLVYARDQLRPQGGCAKPVIYLYPQKPTQVSVRVGAAVTVSDPAYDPAKGWKVLATPSGQLTIGSHSYRSLFWEGPGNGRYPGITSGTVVARSQAVAAIRSQLTQQGLTTNEINDFIAYWQPRLPNKPYIRLTWFGTDQMNQLAPLAVSPRPTTLIRVFLDFDGLDQPINLPAQALTAIPRNGFTVVEWGGLANFPLTP